MNPIDRFFLNLPDAKRVTALELREIILSVDDRITEAIKWNNLTFSLGKVNFAFIYTMPQLDYINLGFFFAVELSDPQKLFEGTGITMRHIKVRNEKDIPIEQVQMWVKETILLKAP